MKNTIFTMMGVYLLFTMGLDAAGLDGLTTTATSIKGTIETVAKVIAAIGLIVIAVRYFMQQSEQRTIPWIWVIGAVLLGSYTEILTLFNIN